MSPLRRSPALAGADVPCALLACALLAGLPERRILLYVGGSLPQQAGSEIFHFLLEVCPHPSSQVSTWFSIYDLTWLYEEVARQANASGLTLYTVEASPPRPTEDIARAGLFYVANETGGRAILNAADLASELERLGTELRAYDSLGFRPDHGGDTSFLRHEIRLDDEAHGNETGPETGVENRR
jgi:hypothetical protein